MNSSFWLRKSPLLCGVMVAVAAAQVCVGADNAERAAILKLVPADVAVALVATNLQQTDKALAAMVKGIDPEAKDVNLLAGIKSELEIGDWVDFSKPFAMIQPDANSGDAGLFFAYVPDFDTKIKSLEGAAEKDGVWEITKKGAAGEPAKPSFFLLHKGKVVAGASVRRFLDLVGKGPDLGSALSRQPKDIAGRDFLVHINMSPLRDKVVGAISMYGPMMAMMAGAQTGGGDAAALTSMMNAMVEGVLGFVKQLATLDVAVDFSVDGVGVTVASRFTDGAIKTYLAKQKPASLPLLATVPDQPYTMAFGYHMPGEDSGLMVYVLEKMLAALPKKPAAEGGAEAGADDANDKTLNSIKAFYGKLEGFNAVVHVSDSGLSEVGDLTGSDVQDLLERGKDLLEHSSELMAAFGMGASGYTSLGKKQFGTTQADTYRFEIDPNNPAAAQATAMMGKDTQFALGIDSGRLRFGFGSEADLKRAFSPVSGKPLAASKYAKAAMGALPKHSNLVVLIDPAGILSMVATFAPMPVASIPPCEPFAFSVSLAGEPARLDVHVPARSIRELMKAFEPDEPM